MKNLLLTRIDNRLVHGQVGIIWTKSLGANLILVADDIVSTDNLQQELMEMTAASSNVDIRFFSLKKTIETIKKAGDWQKIYLIVRSPAEARLLVEGGVPIKEINIGNMHFSEGKKALSKKVYVDAQDEIDIKFLKDSNIDIYIKDLPTDRRQEV